MISKPTRSRAPISSPMGRLLALLTMLFILVAPALVLAQTAGPDTNPSAGDTPQGALSEVYAPPGPVGRFDGSHVPQGKPSAVDASIWLTGFCRNASWVTTGDKCMTGDFNGDGRKDVIRFLRGNTAEPGAVYVALSTGSSFGPLTRWTTNFCGPTEECRVGDVDGDGLDDIVAFTRGPAGNVWVARSNGSQFIDSAVWRSNFCVSTATVSEQCDMGDFDGDGTADIVAFHGGTVAGQAKVWIALSQVKKAGSYGFGTPTIWNPAANFDFCYSGETCTTGDFNGDGKDDLVAFSQSSGAVWVAPSTGTTLIKATRWNPGAVFCVKSPVSPYPAEVCRVADVNGDGKADVLAFTRAAWAPNQIGYVYIAKSQTTSFAASQLYATGFCADNSETCDAGDFNGDRAADLVAFNPSGNVWVSLSAAPPSAPSRMVLPMVVRRR